MKKTITAAFAVAGIMVAFAEISTNTSPAGATAEPKYPWKSSVSAGLTLTRGNKSTTLFTADFTTQRKTPTDEYLLGLGGAYGQQDSRDTVNNYKVFGQWNHLFTERFFGYLRTEGLQDHIKDLDYRLTIGPGAGYYLIKETNTTLAVEAGAGFEAQRLGGKDESFATVRLADRFEHKFNDHARLWQSVEVLPQVDKFDNFVVNFEIGIETSISKSFSLKTYLADTYANRPAVAHKQNDVKIVAAVAYKF
jgi:putative salt-induced outer membrane protein YdiY